MTASILGRRYERLLYLAAPISLISLFLLFVAVASSMQTERIIANCYQKGAENIYEQLSNPKLALEWKKSDKSTSVFFANIGYIHEIYKIISYDQQNFKTCFNALKAKAAFYKELSPEDIIKDLQRESNKVLHSPIQLWGIDLPEKATIDIFGTVIKAELVTLIRLFQFAMAPIMLLWLGSLYATRYRESMFMGSAKVISDTFPHIINAYPVALGEHTQLRKRSCVSYHIYIPLISATLYAIWRGFLVAIFIAPSVSSYIYGLIALSSADFGIITIAVGLIILIAFFFVVFVEFLPWHFSKVFPPITERPT